MPKLIQKSALVTWYNCDLYLNLAEADQHNAAHYDVCRLEQVEMFCRQLTCIADACDESISIKVTYEI